MSGTAIRLTRRNQEMFFYIWISRKNCWASQCDLPISHCHTLYFLVTNSITLCRGILQFFPFPTRYPFNWFEFSSEYNSLFPIRSTSHASSGSNTSGYSSSIKSAPFPKNNELIKCSNSKKRKKNESGSFKLDKGL